VPGELIVRLRPAKVIAAFDVSGLRAYLLRAGCSSKKRMNSALASGPRASV
jgi:hypothetical protein